MLSVWPGQQHAARRCPITRSELQWAEEQGSSLKVLTVQSELRL